MTNKMTKAEAIEWDKLDRKWAIDYESMTYEEYNRYRELSIKADKLGLSIRNVKDIASA